MRTVSRMTRCLLALPVLVATVLLLAVVAGCDSESDDCADAAARNDPYIGEAMFDRCAGMELTVDRPVYTAGDTLTLTIAFEPLYTGVGRLTVWFLPLESRAGLLGVLVTDPALVGESGMAFTGPAPIPDAGRCELPVSFVVRDNTPYHITAAISFVQVRDPATGELLDMNSEAQIQALGRLDHTAYGNSSPLVLARPLGTF